MPTLNYLALSIFYSIVNIYSFNIQTLEGNTISLEQYKGKKMLLVNIATNTIETTKQLSDLERFYQTHKDSIVVIGFPSNSFGNESKSNAELQNYLQQNYHLHFPVIEKTSVVGSDAHPVYRWLQSATDNGVINVRIKEDFQKFLINRNGSLCGLFSSKTSVLSDKVQNAIKY